MARLIVIICGLLICASSPQAWEPDEGGIGGTGVHQPLDHTPPDFETPELPEVFDHLEGPGDTIGDNVAIPDTTQPPSFPATIEPLPSAE